MVSSPYLTPGSKHPDFCPVHPNYSNFLLMSLIFPPGAHRQKAQFLSGQDVSRVAYGRFCVRSRIWALPQFSGVLCGPVWALNRTRRVGERSRDIGANEWPGPLLSHAQSPAVTTRIYWSSHIHYTILTIALPSLAISFSASYVVLGMVLVKHLHGWLMGCSCS